MHHPNNCFVRSGKGYLSLHTIYEKSGGCEVICKYRLGKPPLEFGKGFPARLSHFFPNVLA